MHPVEIIEQDTVIALSQTELIPKDGNWEILASWGIVQEDASNPLFYKASLPEGWTRTLSKDNHRLILVLDESNKCRITIFYKAVEYDRKAYFVINN